MAVSRYNGVLFALCLLLTNIAPLPWKRILVLGACEIDLILVLMKNFA